MKVKQMIALLNKSKCSVFGIGQTESDALSIWHPDDQIAIKRRGYTVVEATPELVTRFVKYDAHAQHYISEHDTERLAQHTTEQHRCSVDLFGRACPPVNELAAA